MSAKEGSPTPLGSRAARAAAASATRNKRKSPKTNVSITARAARRSSSARKSKAKGGKGKHNTTFDSAELSRVAQRRRGARRLKSLVRSPKFLFGDDMDESIDALIDEDEGQPTDSSDKNISELEPEVPPVLKPKSLFRKGEAEGRRKDDATDSRDDVSSGTMDVDSADFEPTDGNPKGEDIPVKITRSDEDSIAMFEAPRGGETSQKRGDSADAHWNRKFNLGDMVTLAPPLKAKNGLGVGDVAEVTSFDDNEKEITVTNRHGRRLHFFKDNDLMRAPEPLDGSTKTREVGNNYNDDGPGRDGHTTGNSAVSTDVLTDIEELTISLQGTQVETSSKASSPATPSVRAKKRGGGKGGRRSKKRGGGAIGAKQNSLKKRGGGGKGKSVSFNDSDEYMYGSGGERALPPYDPIGPSGPPGAAKTGGGDAKKFISNGYAPMTSMIGDGKENFIFRPPVAYHNGSGLSFPQTFDGMPAEAGQVPRKVVFQTKQSFAVVWLDRIGADKFHVTFKPGDGKWVPNNLFGYHVFECSQRSVPGLLQRADLEHPLYLPPVGESKTLAERPEDPATLAGNIDDIYAAFGAKLVAGGVVRAFGAWCQVLHKFPPPDPFRLLAPLSSHGSQVDAVHKYVRATVAALRASPRIVDTAEFFDMLSVAACCMMDMIRLSYGSNAFNDRSSVITGSALFTATGNPLAYFATFLRLVAAHGNEGRIRLEQAASAQSAFRAIDFDATDVSPVRPSRPRAQPAAPGRQRQPSAQQRVTKAAKGLQICKRVGCGHPAFQKGNGITSYYCSKECGRICQLQHQQEQERLFAEAGVVLQAADGKSNDVERDSKVRDPRAEPRFVRTLGDVAIHLDKGDTDIRPELMMVNIGRYNAQLASNRVPSCIAVKGADDNYEQCGKPCAEVPAAAAAFRISKGQASPYLHFCSRQCCTDYRRWLVAKPELQLVKQLQLGVCLTCGSCAHDNGACMKKALPAAPHALEQDVHLPGPAPPAAAAASDEDTVRRAFEAARAARMGAPTAASGRFAKGIAAIQQSQRPPNRTGKAASAAGKAAIAAAFEKHVNGAAAAAGLHPSAGSAHPGSGSAVPAVPSTANSIFGASASASGNATFGILESNGTGVKAGASTSDLGLGTYGTVDAGSINTAASSRSMKEDEANFMRIAFRVALPNEPFLTEFITYALYTSGDTRKQHMSMQVTADGRLDMRLVNGHKAYFRRVNCPEQMRLFFDDTSRMIGNELNRFNRQLMNNVDPSGARSTLHHWEVLAIAMDQWKQACNVQLLLVDNPNNTPAQRLAASKHFFAQFEIVLLYWRWSVNHANDGATPRKAVLRTQFDAPLDQLAKLVDFSKFKFPAHVKDTLAAHYDGRLRAQLNSGGGKASYNDVKRVWMSLTANQRRALANMSGGGPPQPPPTTPPKKKTPKGGPKKLKGACYNCGEVGHRSRDCPKEATPETLAVRKKEEERREGS